MQFLSYTVIVQDESIFEETIDLFFLRGVRVSLLASGKCKWGSLHSNCRTIYANVTYLRSCWKDEEQLIFARQSPGVNHPSEHLGLWDGGDDDVCRERELCWLLPGKINDSVTGRTGIFSQPISDLCAQMVHHDCLLIPCCDFHWAWNQSRQECPALGPSKGAEKPLYPSRLGGCYRTIWIWLFKQQCKMLPLDITASVLKQTSCFSSTCLLVSSWIKKEYWKYCGLLK